MLRTVSALLLVALLAGCASVSVMPGSAPGRPAAPIAQEEGDRLADEGRHLEAARAWAAAAAASRGAARDRAWLQSAEQYRRAGDDGASRQALDQSNRRRMDGGDAILHDTLTAGFRVAAGQSVQAMALLGQPRETVPPAQRAHWHEVRARALEAGGRRFDAAGELAWMNDLLDRNARAGNIRRIDALLRAVPDAQLAASSATLPAGHPLYVYVGRALTARGLPLPRPYDRSASSAGFEDLPQAEFDGYRPPLRLAALLPLSGPAAVAGKSVRDGLLAGYYGENRRRPQLRFYDTAEAGGVVAAFRRAHDDGAQMLVGPLIRDDVDAIFNLPELDLPMVALNRGSAPPPPGSTAFALAPEDEGTAAAERLLNRGHRRVLVVTQSDDAARRALGAFRERLVAGGGEIMGEVAVSEDNPDFVPALQRGMGGSRPDALFLTLKAAPARLLSSQMDLAGLLGVPRVSTSLILSGANLRMDTELDGIEYPELPWLLGLRGGSPDPDTIGRTLPTTQGGGARLFAFGMDAWKLVAQLDQLTRDPAAIVRGNTGELQIDGFGTIVRRPAWAVFSGGRSRPALDGALMPDAGSN